VNNIFLLNKTDKLFQTEKYIQILQHYQTGSTNWSVIAQHDVQQANDYYQQIVELSKLMETNIIVGVIPSLVNFQISYFRYLV